MKFTLKRWLVVLLLAAVMLIAGWQWRNRARAGARQRLAQRYQQRLSDLREREAVILVRELARNQPPWLEVLVEAASDQRLAVAAAAEAALRELVDKWAGSDGNSYSQAMELATLLARRVTSCPPDGQRLANVLARSLLVLPIDSRQLDVAKYIADCETVLRLEPTQTDEIRVASRATEPAISAAGPEGQPVEPRPLKGSATGRITER